MSPDRLVVVSIMKKVIYKKTTKKLDSEQKNVHRGH